VQRDAIAAQLAIDQAEELLAARTWRNCPVGPDQFGPLDRTAAKGDPAYRDFIKAEQRRQPGRCLIGPSCFSDKVLVQYVELLGPAALSPEEDFFSPPVSPSVLPYILGGITLANVDALCERVFVSLGFDPIDPALKGRMLSDVLCVTGFSPKVQHTFVLADGIPAAEFNRWPEENDEDFLRRMNGVQRGGFVSGTNNLRHDWLRRTTEPFARHLLDFGAASCTLSWRIAKVRPLVIAEALSAFNPQSLYMGRHSIKDIIEVDYPAYVNDSVVSDEAFSNAVRRVFEGSWFDLDLEAKRGSIAADLEIVLARGIIGKLSSTGPRSSGPAPKISARTLVGAALLTGIPVGKWVRFGIDELERRGESFINLQVLEEVIELILDLGMYNEDLGAAARCVDELNEFVTTLRFIEEDAAAEPRERWSRKLRAGTDLLWSHKGSNGYYINRIRESAENQDELILYSSKPDRKLLGVKPGEL